MFSADSSPHHFLNHIYGAANLNLNINNYTEGMEKTDSSFLLQCLIPQAPFSGKINLIPQAPFSGIINLIPQAPFSGIINLIPQAPFSQERRGCKDMYINEIAPLPWERGWGEVNSF
jgi:hypothetical protein